MAHGWFFLLLTLGVCGLSSSVPRQFHVVKEQKTWAEAQQYCKREYTDLATIDNMTELEKAKRVIKNANVPNDWSAWIGLKNGDSPKWQWSLADEGFYRENDETEFQNWGTGQPSGSEGEDCGSIHKEDGKWHDLHCTRETRRSLCYNKTNSAQPYVLVSPGRNWADAQRYCREKHTDLASVRNQTENDKIKDLIITGGKNSYPWIGLFRDAWEWSDGSNSSFRHWAPEEPNFGAPNTENTFCARMTSSGLWNDVGEQNRANFICYEAVPTVEVVSPQPPFYSGDNVTLRCDIPKYTGQQQYGWLKNNSTLPDETNQTINITLPEDVGQYQCHRHREGSSVAPYISMPVNITFNDLPAAKVEVVSPPAPFYYGDDVTLRCDIPKYSDWHQYIWLKNNSPAPGETSQTITITLPLEAVQYQCSGERNDRPTTSSVSSSVDIISNALPTATVVVVSPPAPFYSGDEVTLRCDISEYSDWHQYIWLKDNSPVPSETSQTITITLPLEAVQYQCSGERNDRPTTSSVSSSVDIISNALPTATVEVVSPQSPFYSGDVVTLKCNVLNYTDQHQYVWLKDNSSVPGKTSQTINITLPEDVGQYQCYRQRGNLLNTSSVSSSVPILNNDQLVLVKEQKTWKEALEYCREHHEDLVSVSSEQIQRWVAGWAKGASTTYVWVGLRYSCNLGFWFWVSGEIICYDNWTSDQESGRGCTHKVGTVNREGGKWVSFEENAEHNFICTKEGQWN